MIKIKKQIKYEKIIIDPTLFRITSRIREL